MKIAALVIVIALLSFPHYAFAEQGSDPAAVGNGRPDKEMKVKQMKEPSDDEFSEKKDKLKNAMKNKKEEFGDKKEAFRLKLETLKDEEKKVTAERLDGKLDMVNKNRTDRMTDKLAKLKEILAKLEVKKQTLETYGQNVSSVTAAIAAAEQAIATAETAVAAQAAKVYTAEITDETTLKQNFGIVISKLRLDLTATHKTVVDAKAAVKAVSAALKQIEPVITEAPQGESDNGTLVPTETPTISPAM